MSVQRVATNMQAQYLLSQIMQASSRLDTSQQQVASGKVSTDYAGIGGKTAALEAARAGAARAAAYQSNTQSAINQVDLQDTQLTQLANVAEDLRQAILKAAGNNDATGFMTAVQGVFDQASQILNAKDASGNYLFGGDKDNVPPLNLTSFSQLAGLSDVSDAFSNGSQKKTVMVGDGQQVQIGVLASDIGTKLMQTLKDIATFDAGPDGGFSAQLSDAQMNFLTGEMPNAQATASDLNLATGANGFVYNRLTDAADQQSALSTMYKGFVSTIEDVDMGTAITQLNQNQTALQAALQVTAQLGQISLLNFLPIK
ncbi:MAG TPA: flagellin [Rhizomicrobium sp.]|jgi:flagellar hook-associated protein 3 FlgL|nr:flagellin [Rhizomicrobium sp.]